MANSFRRLMPPPSFEFTKFSIKCLGGNHRGRTSCAKIFGFSASIAAFVYGIKAFGEELKNIRPPKFYFNPKIPRIEPLAKTLVKFKPFDGSRYFPIPLVIQKKPWDVGVISDCYSKIFRFLRFFVTPVSCESQTCQQLEDSICECMAKCRELKNANKCNGKANDTNEDSKGEGNDSNANASPPNTSNSNPSDPPPRPTNKPCKGGASRSGCGGKPPADIDLDAISRQLGGLTQIEWAPETEFSHCNLIRKSCQMAVDSVTRIFTETASAYDDYHAEYRSILDTLIDTLEESRQACGTDLEVIECKIVLIKAKADEMKRRIRDLDMFIGSLEKLGNASAEAAFMAHAEYASVAMSERTNSLMTEVKRLRDDTREKERDMLELESLIIIETGKSLK